MKRLLLLRHAKAVPADARADDAARELSARGRDDAAHMGSYLRNHGYQPDLVLCSTAKRTKETWTLASQSLGAAPIEMARTLYLAPWHAILALVQKQRDANTLLVVAHNPGIEDLADELTADVASKAARERSELMAEKFPTAALAVLDFEIAEWEYLAPRTGTLSDFTGPKDL